MSRLTEIIKELIKVIEVNDLAISDECIFEEACSYHRGELINKNRKEDIKEQKRVPATQPQLNLLKKLDLFFPPTISKQEAQILIKENLTK